MSSSEFVMHGVQYASVNQAKSLVTYETRLPNGHCFYFRLSRNQFLNLNDAFLMLEREGSSGDYPLGNGYWFSYKHYGEAIIHDYHANPRQPCYFKFNNLIQYLKNTHRQLLSFLSHGEDGKQQRRYERRRRRRHCREEEEQNLGRCGRQRRKNQQQPTATRKRSLSDEEQSTHQPVSPKTIDSEWETASGSAINADMSITRKDGTVFSKWHSANSGRRHDTSPVPSTVTGDLHSPDRVQLSICGGDSTYSLEGNE